MKCPTCGRTGLWPIACLALGSIGRAGLIMIEEIVFAWQGKPRRHKNGDEWQDAGT